MGTIRAQLHLREILSAPGIQAKILPPAGNEVLINMAGQKFDEQTGQLNDQSTIEFLDSKVKAFIEFVKVQRG
jgi:chromate reductase, NAD(P)H dehydrogenase (quinone)